MAQSVAVGDGDRPLQHDEHARPRISGAEEAIAAPIALHGAEAPDASDVRGAQHREHLVAAGLDFDSFGGHEQNSSGRIPEIKR